VDLQQLLKCLILKMIAPKKDLTYSYLRASAPINADWQSTVYPLQAHALEEPVEQSANAVGKRYTAEFAITQASFLKIAISLPLCT
jgi:hypothetical protein